MDRVVDDLVAADDSDMLVMSMLRGQDLQDRLVDEAALPSADPDLLAGPFAHIVVDEAQELTDAEWQTLLLRCPSRSFTIVGDRTQARHGFTESWQERLERIGLERINLASLSINYRTPAEIMQEAEQVIRAALPDATSSRCWIVVAVNGRDPARPNSFLITGWGNRVAPPNRFDSPASTLGLVLSGGLCRQGPPASPDRRDGQLRGDQRHRVLVDKPAMGQLVERCLLRPWFDCEPRRLERDLPLREYERVHAVIDRPGRGLSCPPRQ